MNYIIVDTLSKLYYAWTSFTAIKVCPEGAGSLNRHKL